MRNIAFFDSGAGGLTVLHHAMQKMPNEHFIYYGDTLHAPYGTKSSEDILSLVLKAVDFLMEKDLKALVLACNTATSVAVKQLRATYSIPIIGMEPAVKLATKDNNHRKILVSATELTLREDRLSNLVSHLRVEDQVEYISLQQLVTFAELYDFRSEKVRDYLLRQFQPYHWHEIDSLVLGCTHFIYFKDILREMIPAHVQLLDGNEGTVNQLIRRLDDPCGKDLSSLTFYLSGEKGHDDYFLKFLDYLDMH